MSAKTAQRNQLKFSVDDHGNEFFWGKFNDGSWEPRTFRVFDKYLDAETLFIDVGGWIGPASLYGAQLASQVLSLEPDPVAFAQLKKNLDLNRGASWADNVELLNRALWHQETTVTLQPQLRKGDSTSSIARAEQSGAHARMSEDAFESETITLDRLLAEFGVRDRKVFVKIDIEGAEYLFMEHVLDTLREVKATVYLSTHPQTIRADSSSNFVRRLRQSYEHFVFCRRLKKFDFALKTDDRGFAYVPLINALGWLLIEKMHRDILLIPND